MSRNEQGRGTDRLLAKIATPEPFAARLKRLRANARLTQTELAERIGVAWNTVARWEMGPRLPSMEVLPELAKVLGVGIGDLFPPAP